MALESLAPSTEPTIEDYLAQQRDQDLLRFITCGSVDDGKSTLIGRLLWDAQQLTDDQLTALQIDSKKHGTQGKDLDFALLVDGLSAEREQGITIDVAYRYFATTKRKFIVADTPGHEQYTRNMVTGASTADVAVILIDARQGVLTQTRRHAYLASLMGIRQVVVAVNKMDLIGFDETVFRQITDEFRQFSQSLGFDKIIAIPLSALKGDNITQRSTNTPWYSGPTLMGCLETLEIPASESERLVFPVQGVIRPDASFRGFSGYVAEGQVRVGDEVRASLSGQTAAVTDIIGMAGPVQFAAGGDAITLKLNKEIDVSRGDTLSLSQSPLEVSDQFEAVLIWMNEDAGLNGRSYDIKLATQWASASITNIKYRIDTNTLARDASRHLSLNDISVCTLATSKPLVFDSYQQSKTLGSFILVDRVTHATVAAGMINHSLRRAQNVHRQALSIAREDREKLNGHKGKVIWFTGLSGSGKSTLANALELELHAKGYRTYILDGDNVRQGLNRDLGFTDADRVENIRRIAEVAKLMMDAGLIVLTAFISPFRREREMAKELIGEDRFVEVYVSTTLEVCEERDVKGLYKKARSGQLPNLSGVGSPYEAPDHTALNIDAANTDLKCAVDKLMTHIK
ncbi:sulfate adenylyltransferase subunit CysN [Pseudomonas fluorescens]|uniref:sulfate adenylyltransferase subunit CysN n=1 Tax=Pseudomonas fluorescens TaxID=294 RepID=UPI0014750A73|nr:sulfate adenylyltransferase subunit CysN [Pseudomonas fluorescens]MBC8784551.1 sulfate adenylyltransferase subunit CysN [Pseudomonas fluorescens]NNB67206.1 sulfate adenylyltransferase subunit CysN [Pseudomonas fluorescens]